jgi:TonB family protein
MRLASALLLSVCIHTAALYLSLSAPELAPESVAIPVTIWAGSGTAKGGSAGEGKLGSSGPGITPVSGPRFGLAEEHQREALSDKREQEMVAGAAREEPLVAEQTAEAGLAVIGSKSTSAGTAVNGPLGQAGAALAGAGSGGNSGGRGGGGSGGLGGEGSAGAPSFVRVSYAYNPRPNYPEVARSEGWQGTVILRVLVDQEGRSRAVEVSRSSGFDALDRAALETVKSWRFHPARYGQRRVESWVRIPIVFSLADLRTK